MMNRHEKEETRCVIPMKKQADAHSSGQVLPTRKQRRSVRAWLPAALILALTGAIFLYLLLTAGQGTVFNPSRLESDTVTVERAEVLNLSYDTVQADETTPDRVEKGSQRALVRLLSGSLAGQTAELSCMVGYFVGPKLALGDRITVLQIVDGDSGALQELSYYEYERAPMVWVVLGLFVLAVLLVGGKTGLKSLLGLGLTVVAMIWILCPLWMKGADPVLLAMGLCALVTVMSLVLLGGTTRKTVCAIVSTLAGVGLAAAFGVLAQKLCRVNSFQLYAVNGEIADLVNLQSRGYPVRIHGILTAGLLIASLGAVMDVAMSLSSAILELHTVNPALSRRALLGSAMRIGRDMVGTMTNTLILAFVGSSLVTVIRLWAQGPSARVLLNASYLSVELISALSSSIGVILTVPLAAAVGTVLFGRSKEPNK